MPSAISVNMFRLRLTHRGPAALRRTASRPTARPASRARAGPRSCAPPAAHAAAAARAASRDHRTTRTGSAGERGTSQKRRVMSASSGFASASARDRARLERHAADRAGARRVAHDLRVHRAGVLGRARRSAGVPVRRCGRRVEIARGVGGELVAAARVAEAVGDAGVLERTALGMGGIDRHPAHGIAVGGSAIVIRMNNRRPQMATDGHEPRPRPTPMTTKEHEARPDS